MSFGTKLFLGFFAAALVLSVVSVGAATAAVYRAGSIAVAVQPEEGSALSIRVPAGLAHLAIALAPADLIDDAIADVEPVWPSVVAAARVLEQAPDFTLLEVRSSGEHVIVGKEKGQLLILVESGGDRVSVALPLSTVRHMANKMDRASRTG
jgi:hypothetical protein